MNDKPLNTSGLYRPKFEKDSCGFGLIAHMDGEASAWLINTAIASLSRLTHRGAIAADGKTGDGCGLLLRKPHHFFQIQARQLGIKTAADYAVGMVFLDQAEPLADQARKVLEQKLHGRGLTVAAWRKVPVDPEACGAQARTSMPLIEQVFVNAPQNMDEENFERELFMAKRLAEKALEQQDDTFYIASLSARLVSYKGLVMPDQLPVFYRDLSDPDFQSSLCVYHQRFSTNTLPQWRLAQPFRYLAHNGEINTIEGNRNWAVARAHKFQTPWLPEIQETFPLVSLDGSDSCSLDNMLEALLQGGMDIFRAMRFLIPPAWQNVNTLDVDLKHFYEYASMHMEPWDGPAGIVLTDGRYAACVMDRNGLRPARYVVTKDRHITLASEIGVYDYSPDDVVVKGRLKPGQMIAADTATGKLLLSEDIDNDLKSRLPYKQWLHEFKREVFTNQEDERDLCQPLQRDVLETYQKLYQISLEEQDQVLRPLAENRKEAVGSMGDDTPFPVLSTKIRCLYDYFRQQFAQVTNPPIDPLREEIVMSLRTCLGTEKNLFHEKPDHAARLEVASPVLSHSKFKQLTELNEADYALALIDLNIQRGVGLEQAIHRITDQAVQAVKNGKVILVLSDRNISTDSYPVQALLATGAVHHRLIKEGLRCDANIVVETATARDSHHFAVLIGNGATAVYPYLAYQSLSDMLTTGQVSHASGDVVSLIKNYREGINKGLFKILSKMGISTITSYRGAQLFESVGLHDEVVNLCFRGTTNRIQGTRFEHLEADQRELSRLAWNKRKVVPPGGLLKFVHGEEFHAYNPEVVQSLHKAVQSGDYRDYQVYADIVNHRQAAVIRDLLKPRLADQAIAVDEVESIAAILPRFDSAGMSLGALSPEAHEVLATAMNTLGGRSNSGEGGEDPARYDSIKRSKIKQVASGRFGVTPAYLRNAEVLQIKIAQGAKPGEGGQLPSHKVNRLIARLRYCQPGVQLISPPPHHDIYSIEDLAQLIFDLKQVNPDALVSVKLVAEAGVGTIAAGVAKAYADLITISGYDGGTGASPLTSVKNAGSPWELGLTETHQVLRANDLRDKVRLQTDGGLKTGLDVIKAAILGAESFGFGTAPMVALGCKYLRICHLNNCATGVATQNAILRDKHFVGQAQMVMNFFKFVAEETRQWMAKLGIRRFEDLIGRTDLLQIDVGNTARQQSLDLRPVLSDHGVPVDKPQYCTESRNRPLDKGELAEQMVCDALPAIENRSGGRFDYQVRNTQRSLGARLSGEIAVRHGNLGMQDNPIEVHLHGTVGQSFGVWNAGGLHMVLHGDANDYVGKGMAGGKLVLRPYQNSILDSRTTPIMGNTCLYGATGGRLFATGTAGERFAVRNSGCQAVVEGVGDHCCEYMTGGVVVVLGPTGINFGAGMTGGFSFVLDLEGRFVHHRNAEDVDMHNLNTEQTAAQCKYLRGLIEAFVQETDSSWGQEILDSFEDYLPHFWLVTPKAAELASLLEILENAA